MFAHRELQQGFLGFLWQMRDDIEQRVFIRLANVIHPFFGHTEVHQFELAQISEQLLLRRCRRRCDRLRDENLDLLHALAHLDELHRTRSWMTFDLAPLSPFVGGVMMIDVGQQETGRGAVDNHPDVRAYADRPEILILGAIKLVERQTGRRRVHLQVEGRGLRGLLLLGG